MCHGHSSLRRVGTYRRLPKKYIKNLPGAHLKGVIYGNTTMPNGRTADDADGAVYAFYQYYAEEAEYAEEADEADA